MSTVSRSEIQRDHNDDRRQAGLRGFGRDSGLDASAQIVAHRLAKKDKGIEHAAKWWRIIDKMTRKRYGAEGENLAYNFSDPRALMRAWINSVRHRKNIRNPKFTHIGIGVAVARSGNTYYVVHFGGK